mgnify:CR=1 FL=1
MANAHRPVNERSLYDALARYRAIVPGSWNEFMAYAQSPQPVTVWRNAPRIGHDAFTAWMEEYEGVAARTVAWDPRLYRLAATVQPSTDHSPMGRPPTDRPARADNSGPGAEDRSRERDDRSRESEGRRGGPEGRAARVKPGNLLAFGAGLYHVQEETAAMPAVLLSRSDRAAGISAGGGDTVETAGGAAGGTAEEAGGGVRILDLCAAPGNKSAQLAQMIRPAGTVVANDVNERRLRSGVPTWERLGLTNIAGTVYDGRNFPQLHHAFHAVLVDAPCTGEGTCRRNPGALRDTSDAFRRRLTETQAALLRRAVELCKPGGRIVYCTCTFAPEENEEQIHALLQDEIGEMVVPEPVNLEGIAGSPGIDYWNGRTLNPGVQQALRIWPHQNDTGGFFIAALRKAASS